MLLTWVAEKVGSRLRQPQTFRKVSNSDQRWSAAVGTLTDKLGWFYPNPSGDLQKPSATLQT